MCDHLKALMSLLLQNTGILTPTVSSSINFVKPWVLHGKNRKTFIAQLMSFAAINSFGRRSCVQCAETLPLGGGFLCTPITRIASSLLSGCKKRPTCCVNQFSCILQLLSNWICTTKALAFSETRLCTLLNQYAPVFSVTSRSVVV